MNTALALLVAAVFGGVVGGSIVYKYKNDQLENLRKKIDEEKNKNKKFDEMFGDMDLKNKNIKYHLS